MKYILASASERRQELLKRITKEFDIVVSNFDEDSIIFQGNVEEYVIEIAQGKALEVAEKLNEDVIVIAADTIVTINNEILGKPKNDLDAYRMLKKLSGNIHKVYSGVVVIDKRNNNIEKVCVSTEVKFSELTDDEINSYINSREPEDKAGAYGIQGGGALFVEKIDGCYYNVVGLPLNQLNKIIKKIK